MIEEIPAQVRLRAYRPGDDPLDDRRFVFTTWKNGIWFSEPRDERNYDEFNSLKSREINRILKRSNAKVTIACISDNLDQIIGYSVATGTHLHWIYVKEDYRKQGIGRLLAKGTVTISEPITKIAKVIASEHDLPIKDPYE